MEILPITIAEPRADRTGAQADEARDGWFAKLLEASDERPDFRDPPAEQAPEPDLPAADDLPRDDRDVATAAPGDKAVETTGERSAKPQGPAEETPTAVPIESPPEQRIVGFGRPDAKLPPEQRIVGFGRPDAKLPPAPTAPDARTGTGPEPQLTAASPVEKITHAGPQPIVAAKPAAISAAVGHNPKPLPEPGAAPAAAPLPQTKPTAENRSKNPNIEPPAKPSGTREDPAAGRQEPDLVKAAAARSKAGAGDEAPRNVQNLQQGFGALTGLTAAKSGPGANKAPAQQPISTAVTPGPGQSAPSGNPAAAEARPAALPSAPPGGATEQVALRIHKAVAGGQERISIKLHPAELGRIEVKLAWSDDGLLRAMISADKGETLELLQRDSRALERTLQDAGVKTDQGSLSFDLRGQGSRGEASDDPGRQTADSNAAEGDEAEPSDGALPPAANHGLHRGLLDLSV